MKPLRAATLALAVVAAAAVWPLARAADGERLGPRLREVLDRSADPQLVWVFLRDKGPAEAQALAEARGRLTPRALARRARRGVPVGLEDAAVFAGYRDEVARRVLRVRHELRWSNALSVWATPEQVRALAGLPFVQRLELVRRYRRGREEPEAAWTEASSRQAPQSAARSRYALDYGTSFGQVDQIGVTKVHELGLHGEGVMVAVFDTGFNNLAHEALAPLAIVAQHDFVNSDADVADGPDRGEGSHGTNTLSVLGGYRDGQLIGPAFAATFILAKTEDTESETPVEEDNWSAAAEWAESLGADVISSSLGYFDYDSPFPSYLVNDLNGETAISTKAANGAFARGLVVVNSAGNSGFNALHHTLGAPADAFGALAIGAVDSLGVRVGFSSVGPTADGRFKPDLAAQGLGVKAASSRFPSGYSSVAGTSFSCPLTAGAVALVLQAHPDYKPEQIGYVLRVTASQAGKPDNLLGWGIVDTLAAIQEKLPEE